MPKRKSMLSAYNLFKQNTENDRASGDWGRLRVGAHSASILCIKETVKDGVSKEIVQNWDNCKITQREEVPLTPPKLGTKTVYNAVTPEGGTEVSSSGRIYHLTVTNADHETIEGEVHILSPEKSEINENIFSPPKPKKKRVKKSKKSKPAKRTLIFEAEKENISPKYQRKDGQALVVKPNKTPRRKDHSQVSVMGASPNEEWKAFQEMLAQAKTSPAILEEHPELNKPLKRMENDPKFRKLVQNEHNGSEVQFGSEYTHRRGHKLAGANTFEAQSPTNMALAPKWINSYMMPVEKLALATSSDNNNLVTVKSDFEMLSGTRIADKIEYDMHAVSYEDNSSVDIRYTKNVLEPPERSNCASKTDAIHLKKVSQNVLTNAKPTNEMVFATSNSTVIEKPLAERLRSRKRKI